MDSPSAVVFVVICLQERGQRILEYVATNLNLTRIRHRNKLDEHINLNPRSDKVSPLAMADIVEALCGAVYVDGNLASLSKIMRNLDHVPRLLRKVAREKPGDPAPFSESKAAQAGTERAAGPSVSAENTIPWLVVDT